MLLRRFLINFLFVVMGCLTGWLTAHYLRSELNASPVVCVISMFFLLTVFVISGQILLMKSIPGGNEPHLELIPRGEISGWIIPRNEPTKAGYPLIKDRVIIGRDIKSDILLNDKSVSRQHVEVLKTQEGHLIRDLDSKNGLYVNSQRVKEQELQHGDTITIGDLEFFYKSSEKRESA